MHRVRTSTPPLRRPPVLRWPVCPFFRAIFFLGAAGQRRPLPLAHVPTCFTAAACAAGVLASVRTPSIAGARAVRAAAPNAGNMDIVETMPATRGSRRRDKDAD